MAYFTHRFETTVALHPVGPYHYTVVYLDPALQDSLPLKQSPRLRVEADVSGVAVQGAWQPAAGRWYLMLPKAPLKRAGLGLGAAVEVAFKLVRSDEVEVPPELSAALSLNQKAREAWATLSTGKQRGLAHWVASAKRPETKNARIEQLLAVLRGEAALPWKRR